MLLVVFFLVEILFDTPYYSLWCVTGLLGVVTFGYCLHYKSVLTTVDFKAGKLVLDHLYVFSRKEVLLIDLERVDGFFVEESRGCFGLFKFSVLLVVYEDGDGTSKFHKLGEAVAGDQVKMVCSAIDLVCSDWKASSRS